MYASRGASGWPRTTRQSTRLLSMACLQPESNVNFDPERLASLIYRAAAVRDQARVMYERACAGKGHGCCYSGGSRPYEARQFPGGPCCTRKQKSHLREASCSRDQETVEPTGADSIRRSKD